MNIKEGSSFRVLSKPRKLQSLPGDCHFQAKRVPSGEESWLLAPGPITVLLPITAPEGSLGFFSSSFVIIVGPEKEARKTWTLTKRELVRFKFLKTRKRQLLFFLSS